MVVSQIEAILLFEGNMHVWIREEPIRERCERITAEYLILDHPRQDEEGGHSANREHGPKPGLTGTPLCPHHNTERIGNPDGGSILRREGEARQDADRDQKTGHSCRFARCSAGRTGRIEWLPRPHRHRPRCRPIQQPATRKPEMPRPGPGGEIQNGGHSRSSSGAGREGRESEPSPKRSVRPAKLPAGRGVQFPETGWRTDSG